MKETMHGLVCREEKGTRGGDAQGWESSCGGTECAGEQVRTEELRCHRVGHRAVEGTVILPGYTRAWSSTALPGTMERFSKELQLGTPLQITA